MSSSAATVSSTARAVGGRTVVTGALMPRPPRTRGSPAPSAGSAPAIVRGHGETRPRDSARNAPPWGERPRRIHSPRSGGNPALHPPAGRRVSRGVVLIHRGCCACLVLYDLRGI